VTVDKVSTGQSEAKRTLLLILLGALVLCARFYQGLLHADLWGDDGWTFYPDAYNYGIHCLLWPVAGYLNSVQRLGALLTVWTHLPLVTVPTVFAVMGLSVQLMVAGFLMGSRLTPLWPDWKSRSAFAFLYLSLPNTFEIFGNLTNAQWHFALLSFMIIVAPPIASRWWRCFDAVAILLSGLSGPFCLILMPLCLFMLWRNWTNTAARRETLVKTILLGFCCCIQMWFLLHNHHVRQVGPLGASAGLLARIVTFQVVFGLLLGYRMLAGIGNAAWWQPAWPSICIALITLAVYVAGFIRGSFLLRMFCVFAVALFAAEMTSPVISSIHPQWQQMTIPFGGNRYFMAPILALAGVLFTLSKQKQKVERAVGLLGLALILLWSVPHDFLYLRMGHTDFAERARVFDQAPSGTTGTFSGHAMGDRPMILVKK
jgi:hypothetical protein